MVRQWMLAMALAAAPVAQAQDAAQPKAIAWGEAVTVAGAGTTPAGQVGCYAISPPAGQNFAALAKANFAGSISIARGALCHANALQATTEIKAGEAAAVRFRAAGGRYLVLVNRTSPGNEGQFTLTVGDAAPLAASRSVPAAPAPPPVDVAGNTAPPPPATAQPVSARRALMLAQVENRRAQLAEEEERRRAAAAEAARRQQEAEIAAMRREAEIAAANANRPDTTAMVVGAFLQGFNSTTAQANESARVAESYNSRIRAMEADYRAKQEAERAATAARAAQTAEQRRVAQENLRAAQARAAAAQSASAAANGGTGGSSTLVRSGGTTVTGDQPSGGEQYYLVEMLAVCRDHDPNFSTRGTVYCQTDAMQGTQDAPDDRSFFNANPGKCSPLLRVTRPGGVSGTMERVYSCGKPIGNEGTRSRITHYRDGNLRKMYTCRGTRLQCATPPVLEN
jgi:hypothetical protein